MSVMSNREPDEVSVSGLREGLANVLNGAVQGKITYVTSRGRRIAAVVPVPVADAAVEADKR